MLLEPDVLRALEFLNRFKIKALMDGQIFLFFLIYDFRIANCMVTNFVAPKSTLMNAFILSDMILII